MTNMADEVRRLLLTLWAAERKPGVRAWAIHIALTYAINKDPAINKREIWKLIQDEYTKHLPEHFPDQQEPSQSYRRASGDAWEMFVEEYLNTNELLRREGIRSRRAQRRGLWQTDESAWLGFASTGCRFLPTRCRRDWNCANLRGIVPEGQLC